MRIVKPFNAVYTAYRLSESGSIEYGAAMKICVATASGIEAVTKREIYKLTGKDDLSAVNGRITIDGGFEEISLLNLRLRTGNRVGIVLGEFKAGDFDSLFGGLKEIPFEDIIPSDGKIIISAKSVKSTLFAYSAIQSVAKKAICAASAYFEMKFCTFLG